MTTEESREAFGAELDRHVEAEERILQEYHLLSDKLPDGPLSVVVDHILTDEEMHHFLLRTLAEWVRSPQTAAVGASGCPDRNDLLRLTRELRVHEQETIAASSDLRERLRGSFGPGEADLCDGVLEAISLDSQKHHRLLEIVEKLVGDAEG
jgi:hypothetical protein